MILIDDNTKAVIRSILKYIFIYFYFDPAERASFAAVFEVVVVVSTPSSRGPAWLPFNQFALHLNFSFSVEVLRLRNKMINKGG